jgi:hypothetical protein
MKPKISMVTLGVSDLGRALDIACNPFTDLT